MEKLPRSGEIRQFKAIFPKMLNANGTLFGGQALYWMDEVAFVTATRFARQRMFTINTENVDFLKAIEEDSIIEIIGRVEQAEGLRLKIKIEVYAEEMYGSRRYKAIEGIFVFASLDENKRPVRIDYSLLQN